jgi:hypothetical protein
MNKILYKMLLVASLASFLVGTLTAEEPAPYITAVIVEVIPGKTNEFIALQKELMEAQKKAGGSGRSVWQEARGNTNTFHIVSDAENFAEQDATPDRAMSDTDWANWINRVTAVTQSRKVLTLQSVAEAYIAPKEGETPNLLQLNSTILASRADRTAYLTWLKEKFTPALRDLGKTGRSVYRVRFGENNNTVVTGIRMNSWAELDEPPVLSSLSEAERQKVIEGVNDINYHENISLILRYRADLSY